MKVDPPVLSLRDGSKLSPLSLRHRYDALISAYPAPTGGRWSADAISRRTNGQVSRTTISEIKHGKRWPGVDKLVLICDAIGAPWHLWFCDAERFSAETLGAAGTPRPSQTRQAHLERLICDAMAERIGDAKKAKAWYEAGVKMASM